MVAHTGKPLRVHTLSIQSIWDQAGIQRDVRTNNTGERIRDQRSAWEPTAAISCSDLSLPAAAAVAFCARGLLTTLLMSQPPGSCPSTSAPTTSRNTQLHGLHFSPCTVEVGLLTYYCYCCSSDHGRERAREKEFRSVVHHHYYGCSIDSAPRQFIPALRLPLAAAAAPPPRHSLSTPPPPPHHYRRSTAPSPPFVRRVVTSGVAAPVASPLDRCARPRCRDRALACARTG
jgi:hypothetical protein